MSGWKGMDELEAGVARARDQLAGVAHTAMAQGAQTVLRAVVAGVPVRSGDLAESYRVEELGLLRFQIRSPLRYAPFVDIDESRLPSAQSEAEAHVTEAIKTHLEAVNG